MVETVIIEKFKTSDGCVFDNKDSAERHEIQLKWNKNIDARVASHQKSSRGQLLRLHRTLERYKTRDPNKKFLIYGYVERKYGREFMFGMTPDGFGRQCLENLKINLEYQYFDDDRMVVDRLIELGDTGAAINFLSDRSDYEYERFEYEVEEVAD